jgi:AGCS family alanine or glycine:cation symporter
LGAVLNLDFVWLVADTLNALMAIPNLIAIAALSPVVFKLTREYFDRKALGLPAES